MSAELTVNSSTCLTSWHDLSVDRKLNESQTGDSTHLLMHSTSNVTWSLWIIPVDIRTPACLVHSIPDKPPTGFSCIFNSSWYYLFSYFIVTVHRVHCRPKRHKFYSVLCIVIVAERDVTRTVVGCVVQRYRTLVFDRRTFPVLRSTCTWRVTIPSTVGQPTRPTQHFILLE